MSENKYVVTLYIAMNNQGEYTAHHDQDQAIEDFNDNYHGPFDVTEIEIVKSAPPVIARKASAELPDDASSKFTLTLTDTTDEA